MPNTLKYFLPLLFLFSFVHGQKGHEYYQEAMTLEVEEKFAEAVDVYQRASAWFANEAKWDSACISKARKGSCYADLKQLDQSILETDSAAAFWEKSDQTNNNVLFNLLSQQAKLELDRGMPEAARPFMRKGVRVFSGEDSVNMAMKASMLSQLGASFSDAGRNDSAIFYYKQSLEIREDLNVESEVLGKAHLNLAQSLVKQAILRSVMRTSCGPLSFTSNQTSKISKTS